MISGKTADFVIMDDPLYEPIESEVPNTPSRAEFLAFIQKKANQLKRIRKKRNKFHINR